jgi:hypothetical protein
VSSETEDGEDTGMPPEWLQILVRRVAPNPYHVPADKILDSLVQNAVALVQQQNPSMPSPTSAELEGLRNQLTDEAENRAANASSFVLEEAELTVCAGCAAGTEGVLADLADFDPDAFAAAGWAVPTADGPGNDAVDYLSLPAGFAPTESIEPSSNGASASDISDIGDGGGA